MRVLPEVAGVEESIIAGYSTVCSFARQWHLRAVHSVRSSIRFGTHQATLRGGFDFPEVPQLDGIILPRYQQSDRGDLVNASQFNGRMKSLQIGASLQEVRDIVGLPLAHVSAAVFEVKPGAQMREFGLDVSFGVESASEYLVYRHPIRRRVLVLCGFRDGFFCGSAQQTFTGDAEEFMLRQIQDWRKQSLSPLSDDTIRLA